MLTKWHESIVPFETFEALNHVSWGPLMRYTGLSYALLLLFFTDYDVNDLHDVCHADLAVACYITQYAA